MQESACRPPSSVLCPLSSVLCLLFSLNLSALDASMTGQAVDINQAVIADRIADWPFGHLGWRLQRFFALDVARETDAPLRHRDDLRLAAHAGHKLAHAVKRDIRQVKVRRLVRLGGERDRTGG